MPKHVIAFGRPGGLTSCVLNRIFLILLFKVLGQNIPDSDPKALNTGQSISNPPGERPS
jgi:hypothetical protein